MITRETPILVDANVIETCHVLGCWRAIHRHFRIETVNKCVEEFQTGGHALAHAGYVDEPTLRAEFRAVLEPTGDERARVLLNGGNSLDAGERDLWAHGLGRDDAWVLCGPDRASMKFGCAQKLADRLVALGTLLEILNHPVRNSIPDHYRREWLDRVRSGYVLGIV